jgi:hypothetical protein
VLARVSNNKIGEREREAFAAASGQKSKPRESQSSVSRFPSKKKKIFKWVDIKKRRKEEILRR